MTLAPRAVWLALLGLCLVVLFFLLRQAPVPTLSGGKRPDIEFSGLQLSELVNGQPAYTLAAQSAAVYLDQQRTDLSKVVLKVPAGQRTPAFDVQSEQSHYDMQVGVFQFKGVQVDTYEGSPLQLQTDSLRWQPGDALMQCDGRVSFRVGNIRGYAERALADLRDQHVTLFNGVHAQISP